FRWRRERDSNARYTFWAYAPLAGECLRPLGHLSDQRAIVPFGLRRRQKAFRTKSVAYALVVRSHTPLLASLGGWSSSKARCNTRTANSRYFSSITTEVLISEVEIIWILIPSWARLLNILAAMPTC